MAIRRSSNAEPPLVKLYALLNAIKAQDGDQRKTLFQFLNEIGARALRMHSGRVLEMAESSGDRAAYEKRIAERFGEQKEFEFATRSPSAALTVKGPAPKSGPKVQQLPLLFGPPPGNDEAAN